MDSHHGPGHRDGRTGRPRAAAGRGGRRADRHAHSLRAGVARESGRQRRPRAARRAADRARPAARRAGGGRSHRTRVRCRGHAAGAGVRRPGRPGARERGALPRDGAATARGGRARTAGRLADRESRGRCDGHAHRRERGHAVHGPVVGHPPPARRRRPGGAGLRRPRSGHRRAGSRPAPRHRDVRPRRGTRRGGGHVADLRRLRRESHRRAARADGPGGRRRPAGGADARRGPDHRLAVDLGPRRPGLQRGGDPAAAGVRRPGRAGARERATLRRDDTPPSRSRGARATGPDADREPRRERRGGTDGRERPAAVRRPLLGAAAPAARRLAGGAGARGAEPRELRARPRDAVRHRRAGSGGDRGAGRRGPRHFRRGRADRWPTICASGCATPAKARSWPCRCA